MNEKDPIKTSSGNLYQLNNDLEISRHENNIGISNGLCWSPDSTIMYFASSIKQSIYSYNFDKKLDA